MARPARHSVLLMVTLARGRKLSLAHRKLLQSRRRDLLARSQVSSTGKSCSLDLLRLPLVRLLCVLIIANAERVSMQGSSHALFKTQIKTMLDRENEIRPQEERKKMKPFKVLVDHVLQFHLRLVNELEGVAAKIWYHGYRAGWDTSSFVKPSSRSRRSIVQDSPSNLVSIPSISYLQCHGFSAVCSLAALER
jgi:hypothetical protein